MNDYEFWLMQRSKVLQALAESIQTMKESNEEGR